MSKKIRASIIAVVVALFALAIVVAPKLASAADIDQVLYEDASAGINVRFEASDGAIEKNVTVNVYVDGDLKNTTELSGVRQTGARVYVEAEHYDVSASINNGGTAEYISGLGYVNVNLGGSSDYVLDVNLTKNGDIDQVLYADEENGINVHFEADEGAIKKNVNVSVYVEGELKSTTALTGVPQSGSHVNITADGYDCYPEIDGGGSAVYIAGQDYVNVNLGTGDTYNLTISLARDKVGGDNTIADETTEYGTFSWVNSSNVNCAFLRTVTVYVDDNPEPVATDTIVTPENLSNSEGSANHQYWFTPNTLLYKTSDVRIEPSTTLNSTVNRHISVYLTSLCGCGLDTCVCDGGCDCPVDCDCDYCTGAALGENQINTGYGILGYTPYGSEEDGSGYNLTVKLYVNGVLAWDELSDQPLRIKGAGDGNGDYLHNLEFEPASGYYYFAHEVNPYDLDTYGDAASTWDQSQGRLDFADTREEMRNYHNVLNIYLWTFPNSVNLNVEKMPAVGDEVWNYTISYDLPDPKTGEMRTWTYNATSFDAAQAQIIPTNTPVTLTGVCEPGKEVEQWRCEDASNLVLGNGIDFTDPAGNEEANGRIVKNASAVLNVRNSFYTTVTVYIDRFAWAKAPTPEEIQDILGESAVTVDCVSPYVSHESETYALADGTFTVGSPYEDGDGYYVDVTVTPDSYIAAYNEDGSEHMLADPDQDKVITFSHDGTKWVAKDGESPLVLEVMCDDVPDAPTDEQIKDLIGDVKVDCVNNEAFHVTGTYALKDGYQLGEVTGDVENGFTVTVSVPADAYVDQYDAETNVEHALVDASANPAVVTLENTGEGWKVQSDTPVVFEVVCENVPEVPTTDELDEIFADGLVTVDCINDEVDPAHEDKTYAVLEGSYLFGEVTSNGDGTFSVAMDVYPARYAQQYSIDTQINHWLDPANQDAAQVTLTYANDAWTADDSAAITVTVKCANETEVPPVPPTGEELNDLEGADITVACVSDESHEEKAYDPIAGAYSYGEVAKNDEGVYEVVMTVTPSEYVKSYVADTEVNHWLAEGQDVAKTLTLQYVNDAWVVASDEGIRYEVVCLPDAPTPDEVEAELGDAAVTVDCVNSNASHNDFTSALLEGSYAIGDAYASEGEIFADVTVTPDAYVDAYNQTLPGHTLVEDQDAVIVFRYVNDSWEAANGEAPLVLQVVCDAEPAPEPPTTDDVEALLANNAVSITCVNDEVEHESATYGPMDYSYWIGQVTGDAESGYECLVTFASDKYVAAYDETTGADHALAEGEQAQKAIKFVWDAENSAWAVDADANPVNFDVVCETPAPEQPDLPGIDELPAIFGAQGAVLIDCVNTEIDPAHDDATYDIKAATYGWENYGADDNGQYTVDLRVSPYAYVVDYSAANGAHALTTDSADSKVITLAYDAEDQAWKIDEGQPQQFAFEVICETPQPEEPAVPELPTDDELQQIFADGLVSVECTTEGVEHELKTYKPIAEGGYAFGEVEGNVEDGATVEMTVFPQAYVGAYEADYDNIPHALNDGQSAAAVTLTYADGAWSVAEDFAPIAYTVFCTTCPVDKTPDAPTIDEVNDLFVDGAVKVTCVNEESGHGSESYELKNGYVTIGNVYGSEAEGWKVDVTAAPGQYVLDFQTAKGVHHTLSPEDQGAQTVTLNFTEDGWALPTTDAQFEFTVICADEPGTDPDQPGDGDDDEPGTNPDEPGDNQSGDNGDGGNKPGANGNGNGNGNGQSSNGSGLAQTRDPVSFVASLMAALGGVSVLGAKSALDKRNK